MSTERVRSATPRISTLLLGSNSSLLSSISNHSVASIEVLVLNICAGWQDCRMARLRGQSTAAQIDGRRDAVIANRNR
jgi:hypothetical protein